MMRVFFGAIPLLVVCLAAVPVRAQPPDDATPIQFDQDVSGRIDNLTLRAAYTFDGRRGEFVSITLETNEGDLDPLLSVLDPDGNLLVALDDGLGRGTRLESLRIPRNGTYTIVVTRFGGALGTSIGNFTLRLSRIGVSSQSGSSLRYNDTIINTITDSEPQHFYSFRARRGDILNIRMQRITGDLDPVLHIVDSSATIIASSDDVPGSSTLDAAVERLVIDADGVYVIVATRYGEATGSSTGSFVLSIEESRDSGLGNTLQTAADLVPGQPVEGELTADQFERFYTFYAEENDLVRLRMDRISGSLDAYLIVLDPNLLEVTFDDDSGGGQNAQIPELRIPADGVYTVKATRYGGTEGETVGRYRLQLDILGGAFDEATAEALPILYGSTITGVISDETPSVLYAFYGSQGDVITVSMNRGDGNLDPVVSILGENQQLLVSDDDSGGTQNARIEQYVLSRTGVYYIQASRYTGTDGSANTRGSYILVLVRVPE